MSIRENAVDSFRRSITYFNEHTQSGLKAAVKELASSIELFLKEKLRQLDLDPQNPALLFERFSVGIADGHYVLQPESQSRTVGLNEVMRRLEWIGFCLGSADAAALQQLKRVRNEIEHLQLAVSEESLERVYLDVLSFSIPFLHGLLGLSFLKEVGAEWQRLVAERPTLRRLAEQSASQSFQALTHAEALLTGVATCSRCGSEVLIEREGGYSSAVLCGACGFSHAIEMCSDCGRNFFVEDLQEAEGGTAHCKSCADP